LKKVFLIFTALFLLTLLINSCTSSKSPSQDKSPNHNNAVNETINENLPSIAGVCLDDAAEIVDMILGDDYEQTFSEIEGHFGEPYYIRNYNDGLSILIGQNSGKVLEIELTSTNYETWQGDKIGDTADKVLSKYREKYTEPETIHSDGKLEGWFDIGNGIILIFDFDKDDNMIVNKDITPDSKVELIKLTKMQYLD